MASTIDLAFVSQELTPYIIECQLRENLCHGSDHLPIAIILDLKPPHRAPRSARSWKCIETHLIRASVKQLPRSIYLNSPGEIDCYLDTLFAILFNIVTKIVFFAKLNIYAVSWWTADVNTTVQNLKKTDKELTRNLDNFDIRESWERART